jgi:hypothetical protein
VRLRTDSRVITSRMASAAATSPAVSTCITGELEEASAAGPSSCQAVREPPSGAGLGIAEEPPVRGGSEKVPEPVRVAAAVLFRLGPAGTMIGNRSAALPAAMTVTMARSKADAPWSGSAGGTAADRLTAVCALAEPAGERPEAAVRDAERAGLVLEEGDRAGLALAVGEGDAEWVGLALAVGDGDVEWVGLALEVGDGDAEWVGLALADGDGDAEPVGPVLAVGDGDAEPVGLALAVGDGDAEPVGLALAVGDAVADADVDGDVDGDADLIEVDGAADGDCDTVPLADGGGELDAGVTTSAAAEACTATDSPQTSRAPPTRRATTARMSEEDV